MEMGGGSETRDGGGEGVWRTNGEADQDFVVVEGYLEETGRSEWSRRVCEPDFFLQNPKLRLGKSQLFLATFQRSKVANLRLDQVATFSRNFSKNPSALLSFLKPCFKMCHLERPKIGLIRGYQQISTAGGVIFHVLSTNIQVSNGN